MKHVIGESVCPSQADVLRDASRVLVETEQGEAALRGKISDDHLRHMKTGLARWIEGGEQGYLVWGLFTFR